MTAPMDGCFTRTNVTCWRINRTACRGSKRKVNASVMGAIWWRSLTTALRNSSISSLSIAV